MKLEFSAGGIIFCQNANSYQFVLILDQYGQWTFPKGHIEKEEKPETAALREIEEEVGIKKVVRTDLIEKIDYWFKFNDELIHKFVYMFLVEIKEKIKLRPQLAEITAAEWFSPEELVKNLGYKKDNLSLIKKAFDRLEIKIPISVEENPKKA